MVTEIVSKENIEKVGNPNKLKHSKFPMGAPYAQTHQYGQYAPVKAMNVVPDDGPIEITLPTDLRSYTLKAPMMGSNMRMKQDMFIVPMEAYLPNSAEYIQKNPKRGDDVNNNVNSVIYGFRNRLYDIIYNRITWIKTNRTSLIEIVDTTTDKDKGLINEILKALIFMESTISAGSLLCNLEYSVEGIFQWIEDKYGNGGTTQENKTNFGQWFDHIINKILNLIEDTNTHYVGLYSDGQDDIAVYNTINPQNGISFRQMLCKMREDTNGTFEANQDKNIYQLVGSLANDIFWNLYLSVVDDTEVPFNYNKLCAYQIICAHYYSNDNVDYIYNAQLWRDNLMSLYLKMISSTTIPTYTYNGIKIPYDACSGYCVEECLTELENSWNDDALNFWLYLASYRRSLRDVDYFTGARTQPLAVGNVDVAVDNNKVSVIEITKNIQRQKFLNAVNRAKNGIAGYIKEIFGIEPKADYHNPFWLGHTTDKIGTPETENTASEQYQKDLAITSQFRCGSSTKQFTVHCDRYGVLMILRYFDIPRLYYRGIHRHWFEADRYDMFIPEMQYIGDQPIYIDELDANYTHDNDSGYFGYSGRDTDYKQNYGRAMGAFVHNLPGYVFLADHNRGLGVNGIPHIGPDYIRSTQTELDEYYNHLNGYSLETYFHFLVITAVMINASRPMAYNPQILR